MRGFWITPPGQECVPEAFLRRFPNKRTKVDISNYEEIRKVVVLLNWSWSSKELISRLR